MIQSPECVNRTCDAKFVFGLSDHIQHIGNLLSGFQHKHGCVTFERIGGAPRNTKG